MTQTIQNRLASPLEAIGEKRVLEARTQKYRVYTCAAGGFYYLGKSGALLCGKTSSVRFVVSKEFKQKLLEGFK